MVSRKQQHLEDGWLTITATDSWTPKNKSSERDVPIPEHLIPSFKAVKKWPSMGALLSNTKRVRPELVTHSWRHGWRTAARAAGANELTAETLMGHTAGTKMDRTYGVYPRDLLITEARKVWNVLDSWDGRQA